MIGLVLVHFRVKVPNAFKIAIFQESPRMAVKNVTLLSLKMSSKKHKLFINISTNSFWIQVGFARFKFQYFPKFKCKFYPCRDDNFCIHIPHYVKWNLKYTHYTIWITICTKYEILSYRGVVLLSSCQRGEAVYYYFHNCFKLQWPASFLVSNICHSSTKEGRIHCAISY